MMREYHVRFWESAGLQLPRATRLVVRIAGKRTYLWRAVDDEGEVLDMLVQRRRDGRAALRLMRKLLKKQGFAPKLLVHRQAALLRLRVPASSTDLSAWARASEKQ
jgi:transposase-like protein